MSIRLDYHRREVHFPARPRLCVWQLMTAIHPLETIRLSPANDRIGATPAGVSAAATVGIAPKAVTSDRLSVGSWSRRVADAYSKPKIGRFSVALLARADEVIE
jgi:hypothetical protein